MLVLLSACFDAGTAPDAGPDVGRDVARDSPPTPEGAFRVGTWNLQAFPRSPRTVDTVAALARELDFDLVGIQEITDRDAFDALAANLGFDAVVSFGSDGFTRVGFLYDPSSVRVSEIERLFAGDAYAFPRSPVKARVEVLGREGEVRFDFVFVVVHLKALGDAESRQRRAAAIVRLEGWMEEQLLGPEQDILVVGDFNDLLTDSPVTSVFTPLDDPSRFRFLTETGASEGDYSYPSFESFIDHVLVTTDALDEYGAGTTEVAHFERTEPAYFRDVSDHLPVVSTFMLP